MATYGRGQMLGAGIDPRMFVQDYSGFANAGAIQGQGMAQLGADIGGGIKDFGEAQKERKKIDAENKANAVSIEAAMKLGDNLGIDLRGVLGPIYSKINDPNTTPMEALAYGKAASDQIKNAFTLSIAAQQAEFTQGIKGREIALREAAASAPPESKWTSFESKRDVDGKQYTARIRQNQFGVVEGSDGKQYRTIDDFWAGKPMEEFSAGDEFALPSGGADPNAGAFLPSRTSRVNDIPPGNTMPIDLGDGSPTPSAAQEAEFNRNTPVVPVESGSTDFQEPARQIQGALGEGGVYIPSGAVETSKPDQTSLTKEEVDNARKKGASVSGKLNPDGSMNNATITYPAEKKEKPSLIQQREESFTRARQLYNEGKDAEAVAVANAAGGKGLLGMMTIDDLPSIFGEREVAPTERPPISDILE
jgi:hypothetical protein